MSAPRSQRSLLDVWSALGLMLATGGAFAAIFPLSRERETHAMTAAPDMLALSYLNLALSRDPTDQALRVRVAERTLEAGQFDRARALLAPLPAGHTGAARLRVEIDYRAWAAVDADDERLRAIALARLTGSIEQADSRQLVPEDAERLAWIGAQVGLRSLHARILDEVARRDLGHDERLRAADAAWLELNDPLSAAQLRAARALALPQQNGRVHASLALRRALASGQPGPALVLFRQLRPRYGKEARVLELGLAALAGVDDVEALAVAKQLLELRPDDAALRQRIAALDAWTRGAPNVPEAARFPRPLPEPAALRWDGSDADAALAAGGVDASAASAQALELAALFESLGAPEQALARLDAALAAERVDERALWDVKVGVQLRLGDRRGALASLEQMDARFGATEASLRRRAELLLALGDLEAALALLDSVPGPRAVADARRITAIGWELGDVARVRDAYRVIAASSEATSDDVRRLWLLERDSGDLSAGARAALAGYQRVGDVELLKLALHTAVEANDDALVEAALDAGEKAGARIADDAASVRLTVGVRQQRAYRALLAHRPARARAELARSAQLLEQARAHDPEAEADFGELWQTQDRQTLNVALAQDDHRLLARVYPEQAEKLTARERVFVLHRLGRDEEAVDTALASLEDSTLPEHDTSALEADADALGADMPRQLGVLFDVQSMAGLSAVRAGALARSSWSGGRSLDARVEVTRLGSGEAPSLYLPGRDELAAEVGAGLGQSRLHVGVVALDGRDPRPSLRFEQGLGGGAAEALDVDLIARVNERSRDTPLLRVLGVEDELSARASLAFAGHYSATLHGAAKLYSLRVDRDYLGAGATLDAAVGRYWLLPGGIGNANVRAAGYVAPRFAASGEEAASLVPDGASWVGLGAGFSRGQLSVAPVAGRRLSVLADATAGWLLPLDELGWSGQLGLGISVLGADQLSILASASNVVSSVPGFAVYTLGADYRVSSW
jgi:hypothetical protein